MTEETMQLPLLPTKRPKLRPKVVDLNELPPDEMLVGPPPDRDLLEGLLSVGQLYPIILHTGEEGRYEVVSGRRRIKAFRRLLAETNDSYFAHINAVVGHDDLNGLVADTIGIIDNATHDENPASDLASIEKFMRAGKTEAEISAATRLPRATLKERLRLLNLVEYWREQFDTGKLSTASAKALARLTHAEQNALGDRHKSSGKMTTKQIEAFRKEQVEHRVERLPGVLTTIGDVEPVGGAVEMPPSFLEAATPSLRRSKRHFGLRLSEVMRARENGQRLRWSRDDEVTIGELLATIDILLGERGE